MHYDFNKENLLRKSYENKTNIQDSRPQRGNVFLWVTWAFFGGIFFFIAIGILFLISGGLSGIFVMKYVNYVIKLKEESR